MKLMKWLKSEIEVSPSNKKRATDSPASGKPTELCRNESYLKALTKFNQWRQSHLKVLASKQQKSKAKSFSAGDECGGRESTSPKPNDTQPYYEEIDCKADTPLYDTANESKLVQHDDDDDEDEDEDDGADEHLYSIPLQDYSNAPSSSTHHDECLEECFDAWNRKQCKQETASKRSRLITDLDKSQDFITAVEEVNSLSDVTTVAADDASFTAGLKLLSETVVCAMSEIKVHNEYPQCNIKNFFIRHGTVNAMDTSFLQMKGIDYNIIYSNSEAMRKLRHPNLILLLGISLDTNSKLAALLLEPVECSLYDRIYYRETHIPLDTCHKYALQLTSAVGYLHMRGLIHTNICSENVLLCGAAGMAVKLAGFELSSTTQDNNRKCLNQMSSSQPKCRQLSAEFRRRYTTYFYQAPELLSNTADHITATYHTDIYGICITLWEMLNCVIPYMQFSYDELLKVFSLRRAQLTAYDRRRQQPFNELLEKGLEIESGQRFRTADELKDALNHIRLDSPSEAFNWNSTFEKHLRERNNFAAPSHSTLRRAYENVSPCSSQPSLDRSDIKVEIPGSDAEIKSPNSFGGKVLKTTQTVERDTVENRRTPSRKFNVSILIKSKSNVSANLSGAQRIDISPITGNSTNVRQIACERYEIRLKSPINGGVKNAANKMEERKIQCINCDCSDGKQRGGNAAASTVEPQAELVTTEDFYIDDDFAQQSCAQVGANFQMEFNYECL